MRDDGTADDTETQDATLPAPRLKPLRLPSTLGFGAPGTLNWLGQRVYPWQPSVALDTLASVWPTLPAWALVRVLAGVYKIQDDGSVLIEPPEDGAETIHVPETVAERDARLTQEDNFNKLADLLTEAGAREIPV